MATLIISCLCRIVIGRKVHKKDDSFKGVIDEATGSVGGYDCSLCGIRCKNTGTGFIISVNHFSRLFLSIISRY